MNEKKIFTELLVDLERAYAANAHKTDMEYTYGFMDALAVVRRKIEEPTGLDPWKAIWALLACAAFSNAEDEKTERFVSLWNDHPETHDLILRILIASESAPAAKAPPSETE